MKERPTIFYRSEQMHDLTCSYVAGKKRMRRAIPKGALFIRMRKVGC